MLDELMDGGRWVGGVTERGRDNQPEGSLLMSWPRLETEPAGNNELQY